MTAPKKPTTKKPAAKKPAPARKPSKPGVYDGSSARPSEGAITENKLVERFAFLSDDRLALAALARRFYPDMDPTAARVKLHGHLSATAKARSLTDEEEAKLLALVEDLALFLLHKCQPKSWEPAGGTIRSMDLIWADNGQRTVTAVDKPDGTGRFLVFIPAFERIDGQEAHMIPAPRPARTLVIRDPGEAPARPSFSPEDFGR